MKKLYLTMTIAVFLLIFLNGLQAQTMQTQLNQVCLDNTEQFLITSEYVKGETYVIQVGLPFSYSSSNKSYPVLYSSDGDIGFGMIKGMVDLITLGGEMKEIIVIGISYGQGLGIWNKKRTRDLTTGGDTTFADAVNAGGADNFIKFIQYELFPIVNKNYRTNPDSIAISGTSLGGLFNSYILFKQPELFKNYIIISPSLHWRNKNTLKLETEFFSNHKELNALVYVAYGSLESKNLKNAVDEFIRNIQLHNYKGLRLVTRVFEGETHITNFMTTFPKAMKTLFHS